MVKSRNDLFLSSSPEKAAAEEEIKSMSGKELAQGIRMVEECANKYYMNKADANTVINSFDMEIKKRISESRISKEEVNNAINSIERLIAMGGFTYKQKPVCKVFTRLSLALQGPKDRY